MSIFSLSLIFISPLIVIAIYIFLQESNDPLRGYHDKYLKQLTKDQNQVKSLDSSSAPQSQMRYRKPILISFISLSIILILLGATITTLLFLLAVAGIYYYWDRNEIKRLVKKALESSESEFPSIIELFTVLISSGESPSSAIAQIASRSTGELSLLLKGLVKRMDSGLNLTQSLEWLGLQTKSITIRRFCDTLILAIERGTPLAEVLQRQVQEVRDQAHAELLRAAGKAEIALMIPVIFLILPISILFALWPSYISLGQSVGLTN